MLVALASRADVMDVCDQYQRAYLKGDSWVSPVYLFTEVAVQVFAGKLQDFFITVQYQAF